jgi:hypothetical protein
MENPLETMGKYGKIWENMAKYAKIWENHRKIWESVGKYGENHGENPRTKNDEIAGIFRWPCSIHRAYHGTNIAFEAMAIEIVDFPTKNVDFLQLCKRLPEGTYGLGRSGQAKLY